MALKLLQTLIPVLSLALSLLMIANKVHSQDTTTFDYSYFDPDPTDLTYQGDAHVPSGESFLRLVSTDSSGNPRGYSVGRVLYSSPILFWEPGRQASFNTTIKFFITPVDDDPADGIAFFIAPDKSTIPSGSTGGNLGIFDSSGSASSIFAVEFDVFTNIWDPEFRHIGIDINSRNSIRVTRFDNAVREEVTANITYESTTGTTSVVVTSAKQTFSVSYVQDLKTVLPQHVQVGISASTGASVALHDILSWAFTSTLVSDDYEYMAHKQDHHIRQYVE